MADIGRAVGPRRRRRLLTMLVDLVAFPLLLAALSLLAWMEVTQAPGL